MDGGYVERLDDCVWLFNLDGCVERLEYNIRRLFLLMFTRSRFASQVLRRGCAVVFCQGLDWRSSEVRSCGMRLCRVERRRTEYYIKCWLRIIYY